MFQNKTSERLENIKGQGQDCVLTTPQARPLRDGFRVRSLSPAVSLTAELSLDESLGA